MRKLILFFPFVLFTIYCNAQQKYRCAFRETTISVIPDSLFRFLAAKGTDLSPSAVERFLGQYRIDPPSSSYNLKLVRAGQDQTIVGTWMYSKSERDTIETLDSFLYKKDEIFNSAPSPSGFSDKPWDRPKKVFKSTDKKISILDYQCDEYISTDSTCYIWISTELPEYINPGVRTNNVKGAVLGFRLIRQMTDMKSILVKLEKEL
jgi:hypothetical protein